MALRSSRVWARRPALITVAGALVAPLLYLTVIGKAQMEVGVVERASDLLFSSGTPFLVPHGQSVTLPLIALSAMAVAAQGVPHAVAAAAAIGVPLLAGTPSAALGVPSGSGALLPAGVGSALAGACLMPPAFAAQLAHDLGLLSPPVGLTLRAILLEMTDEPVSVDSTSLLTMTGIGPGARDALDRQYNRQPRFRRFA